MQKVNKISVMIIADNNIAPVMIIQSTGYDSTDQNRTGDYAALTIASCICTWHDTNIYDYTSCTGDNHNTAGWLCDTWMSQCIFGNKIYWRMTGQGEKDKYEVLQDLIKKHA